MFVIQAGAVSEAIEQAARLAALAASIADGSAGSETSGARVPEDDRRGKRRWNAVSPDFVGREELAAADELEKLLPAIGAGKEDAVSSGERWAGLLGRREPGAGERLAVLARLADLDLQV